MRQKWVILLAGLTMCALAPALPRATSEITYLAGETPLVPEDDLLVEDTFYLTEGIEASENLLPLHKGVTFQAGYLAAGVSVDAAGRLTGAPQRSGTYAAPVRVCSGQLCEEEHVRLIVLQNVPWEPRQLTFFGRPGTPLDGEIGVEGGPGGVLPTFTVTDHAKVPKGVAVGPDGHVGGVPGAAGISEIPVRVCVAGNCAGVVVRLIVV